MRLIRRSLSSSLPRCAAPRMLREVPERPERLLLLTTENLDPFLNLAAEAHLFQSLEAGEELLFLWRNGPSVIIGRNQNPWKECDLNAMEERQVQLVRRESGGGAVYHDAGNTNFTFVSPTQRYEKAKNTAMIVEALRRFGVEAVAHGRNDIVVGDGAKISGHAYKHARGRTLHHGTILRDVDTAALGKILNPNKEKLKSKGVASAKARVRNLVELVPDITHEAFCQRLSDVFLNFYVETHPEVEVERRALPAHELLRVPEIDEQYQKLVSQAWRFGESPDFENELSTRFDWGVVELHIDSAKGQITRCKLYSDSLHPEVIEVLQSSLNSNVAYDAEGIDDAKNAAISTLMKRGAAEEVVDHVRDFATWFKKQL